MCLSLVQLTVAAYGNERIELEKSNFDPSEVVAMTISGITGQMVTARAFLAIKEKGANHQEVVAEAVVSQGSRMPPLRNYYK